MLKITLPINRGFAAWPFYVIPTWAADSARKEAYSAHERTHCRRQRFITPVWWALYFLSRKFRWQEEKLAYAVEINTMKKAGLNVDADYFIFQLSENYWGMVTEKEAAAWLQTLGVNQHA